MVEPNDRSQRPPLRFMRLRDLVETSDDVISFVEKYQKVWETEGRAMISLGEFLTLRAESMRYQVEMMKMGNDGFKRYNEWLEAVMSFRPDTIMQAFMRPPERTGGPASQAAEPMADDKDEDAPVMDRQFEQGQAQARTTTRPALRGTLHGAVAVLAPAGLILLLLLADSPRGYVAAALYATSVTLLYWTSASYHLAPWPHRLRRIMMRLDHSMIFVLIAGTYTPFCLIVVGDAWGIPMLSVVWTLAGLGILLKVCWPDAPRWLSVSLYIGLGWIGVVAAWPLVNNLPWWEIGMLAAGGLLYTIGALVYARRWPDPNPRVFGYHEVFHVLVVAGSALHFSLIAMELA